MQDPNLRSDEIARTERVGNAGISVTVAQVADDELVAAFETLIPQLSSSNPPPGADMLQTIIDSEASTLLIARDDRDGGRIVGSLTLAIFTIPTGTRAWIEDVVVDSDKRGRGIGQTLNQTALELARQAGATTVDLTSRPSREAANRLYKRIGFEQRSTNVYRFEL